MAEMCTTNYVVFGNDVELRKVFDFIKKGEVPKRNIGGIDTFFYLLNDCDVEYVKKYSNGKDAVLFSLDTKYSPDHKYVGAAIYAAVGHEMEIFYESSCLGCGDYRTNNKDGTVMHVGKYVWDYEGQDEFPDPEGILIVAEEFFGRKFTSLDDVNEYTQEEIGRDVAFEYVFEEPDFQWEELELEYEEDDEEDED